MQWPAVLMGSIGIALGLVMVGLGIRLLSRRPLFLPPKALLAFVAVAFAPLLLVCGGVLLTSGDMELLIPLGLALASVVVMLMLLRKALGMVMFFNVTEDMLYDRLGSALDEAGLRWQESRSKVEIADRDASVKVNIQGALHSGSLLVRGEDSEEVQQAVSELPEHFDGERLERRSFVGVAYTIMGLLLLALQGLTLIPVVAA